MSQWRSGHEAGGLAMKQILFKAVCGHVSYSASYFPQGNILHCILHQGATAEALRALQNQRGKQERWRLKYKLSSDQSSQGNLLFCSHSNNQPHVPLPYYITLPLSSPKQTCAGLPSVEAQQAQEKMTSVTVTEVFPVNTPQLLNHFTSTYVRTQ